MKQVAFLSLAKCDLERGTCQCAPGRSGAQPSSQETRYLERALTGTVVSLPLGSLLNEGPFGVFGKLCEINPSQL